MVGLQKVCIDWFFASWIFISLLYFGRHVNCLDEFFYFMLDVGCWDCYSSLLFLVIMIVVRRRRSMSFEDVLYIGDRLQVRSMTARKKVSSSSLRCVGWLLECPFSSSSRDCSNSCTFASSSVWLTARNRLFQLKAASSSSQTRLLDVLISSSVYDRLLEDEALQVHSMTARSHKTPPGWFQVHPITDCSKHKAGSGTNLDEEEEEEEEEEPTQEIPMERRI
jgi:hypothetical protein